MNRFKPLKQKVNVPYILISCILLLLLVVGVTLAFFYDDDSATSNVTMSGQVRILAVGEGTTYSPIEDTTTSNLVIKLQDNYSVLIPGMEISIHANCKVLQSTTKPLLRAKMELILTELDTSDDGENNADDSQSVISDIYGQFSSIILDDEEWVKYKVPGEDTEYFYYIGSDKQTPAESKDYVLKSIDATENDTIIHFIDEPIIFPNYVTSAYSGLGVKIVITFQAIQNYIPDSVGKQLPNTIHNSQKIFSHFSGASGTSGTSGTSGS